MTALCRARSSLCGDVMSAVLLPGALYIGSRFASPITPPIPHRVGATLTGHWAGHVEAGQLAGLVAREGGRRCRGSAELKKPTGCSPAGSNEHRRCDQDRDQDDEEGVRQEHGPSVPGVLYVGTVRHL